MGDKNKTTLERDAVNRKGVAVFYLSENPGEKKDTNLFRHRVLYEGRFVDPRDPKKWMVITPEHLEAAVSNFKGKVMDKVNAFWSHSGLDDPRNVTGEVVGLEIGEDPKDKKRSLYAVSRLDDPAAVNYAETNKGGVSLGLDHEYREHEGGNKVGLVVKHLALVPQGWIHKLGDWIPLPQSMHDATVKLDESHGDGVIFMAEEKTTIEEEKDDKKPDDKKITDPPKPDDKDKGKDKKVELTELQAEAKKLGFDLTKPDDLKKLMTPEQIKQSFASLNLSEEEWKNPFEAVIARVNTSTDAVKKVQAERAVDLLLQENKIAPALKETMTQLFMTNKGLFDTMTSQLKPGAVNLGENGTAENTEPGKGKVDEKKEIARYLTLAEDVGIPIENGESDISKQAVSPVTVRPASGKKG